MKIGTPREVIAGESRVALTPDSALQLQKLGHECVIEAGAGALAGFSDKQYKDAGVEVVKTAAALWKAADVVAKVRPPTDAEMKRLREGQTLISFFNPGGNEKQMQQAADKGATVVAMEMVPRISRAQKMDALSSMANIAGYRAVIEAGNNFGRFFTGQITAAGKVPPAKVLVIGAGVAGLAAIGDLDLAGRDHLCVRRTPRGSGRTGREHGRGIRLSGFRGRADGRRRDRWLCQGHEHRNSSRGAAGQVPRAGAGDRHRDHHRSDPGNREAPELWTEDMVKSMKAGSRDRRPGRGKGRQLQAHCQRMRRS